MNHCNRSIGFGRIYPSRGAINNAPFLSNKTHTKKQTEAIQEKEILPLHSEAEARLLQLKFRSDFQQEVGILQLGFRNDFQEILKNSF